ncbi:unnamed protein product, partial [Allacma fusca]
AVTTPRTPAAAPPRRRRRRGPQPGASATGVTAPGIANNSLG